MTPCRTCAMLLINSGIKRVVCERKYHQGEESEKMFADAGIEITYKHDEVQKYWYIIRNFNYFQKMVSLKPFRT